MATVTDTSGPTSGRNWDISPSTILGFGQTLLTPILAIFTALVAGAILILLAGRDPLAAYTALVEGALLSPRGLTGTLIKTTPLLLSGMALGVAFKAGLFNIGAQGQLIMGSVVAAWAGAAITGLPAWAHILVAMSLATLAGSIWGAIPGALKAYTDAHEVITTIMFNFIASRIAEWLISLGSADGSIPPGPLADQNTTAISRTKPILESAALPKAFITPGSVEDLHIGFFIAIAMAFLVLIILNRTTFGFEIRMVGLNPNAARYAGVNVKGITISTMALAGALAGMAGGIQTLGVNGYYEANQSLGLGFDSITVSLLAGNHPIGTIFSAFLFGAMDEGTRGMQLTGVAKELILVIQALTLMFVAAPGIIRYIYRINLKTIGDGTFGSSWG